MTAYIVPLILSIIAEIFLVVLAVTKPTDKIEKVICILTFILLAMVIRGLYTLTF